MVQRQRSRSMNESHKLLVRFIYPRKPSESRSHCPTPPIHPLPLPAPKPLFRTPYKHRILTRFVFRFFVRGQIATAHQGFEVSDAVVRKGVGRRSFRYCRWDRNTQPAITSNHSSSTSSNSSSSNPNQLTETTKLPCFQSKPTRLPYCRLCSFFPVYVEAIRRILPRVGNRLGSNANARQESESERDRSAEMRPRDQLRTQAGFYAQTVTNTPRNGVMRRWVQWQIYTINKIWGGQYIYETSADKKPCRKSCEYDEQIDEQIECLIGNIIECLNKKQIDAWLRSLSEVKLFI